MIQKHIEKKQEELNALYEEQGLTDEILDKQIYLNKLKNAHNITIKKDKYLQ